MICRKCRTKQYAAWRKGKVDNADNAYNEWLDKVNIQLKTDTETLTESQWMEACKHFGGCAYCGDTSIDARSMFIAFKDGGRYANWNIVPACERCETSHKHIENPFKRMDQHLYRSQDNQARKYNYSVENLQKITDYLQSKMEVSE